MITKFARKQCSIVKDATFTQSYFSIELRKNIFFNRILLIEDGCKDLQKTIYADNVLRDNHLKAQKIEN